MLLLTLIAIDFGRIYLGWINLQTAARAAGNFAANHPEAWIKNETDTIAEYRNQVINDTAATNCLLDPEVPADPTFEDGNGDGTRTRIGDRATVALTCTFTPITPIISSILGDGIPVSASAMFPVKRGQFTGGGGGGGTAPVAEFTASPTSATTGSNIEFTDASTGSPTTWSWDFGDGATSDEQDPTHAYSAAGTYTVELTVTNASGTDKRTRTDYITITNPAPVADFSVSTQTPAVGQTVTFTDTSTGSPTGWSWSFGDGGSINSGPVVSHAYNTAGPYTVTLTVTSGSGSSTVTKTNFIVVSAATCTVPSFVSPPPGTRINSAPGIWSGRGFTSTIQEAAGHSSGNYRITFQSIVANTVVACNSVITVNG